MRLTLLLLKRKYPRGHIFRGKYRLVKEVDAKARADLRHTYAIEEQNMFYLRHPYLSAMKVVSAFTQSQHVTNAEMVQNTHQEQSYGHAKALGKPEQWLEKFRHIRTKPWKESVTLEERLKHLRVKEAWD